MSLAPEARRASWFERLFAAYPLLLAYLLLLILYAWQTTKHSTPWLFTDELQWSGLSRGVAHHGVPQLRLHNASFGSLYTYLIAPAWWAGATAPAYAAAKYINAAVMTASLFPAYALARLVVPRYAAIACGIATASIPALAYTGMLIPESLAYFWSTLALWLLARALLRPSRATVIAAVAAVVLAPLMRAQLEVLIFAALIAWAIVAATGQGGRQLIGGWSWRERLGAVVLGVGGMVAAGAFANHHSYSWQIGTHFHQRMFDYGVWSFGALAIGLGVLPLFAALTWVLGSRFDTPDERVLAGVLIGALVAFGLYTAVKASYLSTTFAIRVEERNVIYVAPVVFVAAARWLLAGRARVVPIAVAAGCVAYLLDVTPYHNNEHFYSDAPGLSILQWFNRTWAVTTNDARHIVFGILIGSVVLAVVYEVTRRRGGHQRTVTIAAAVLGAAVIGWNLTGEIAAGNASNSFSDSFRGVLPTPPDWIDRQTGRARTMVLGQSLAGSNAFWSLEFWNQSIGDVWSVDSSAPGPGPVTTPNYLDLTGALDPQLPLDWIVATPGVDPVGRLVETVGGLRIFHVPHPIRLAEAQGGISPDGWMSTSAWYYRFTSAGTAPGVATVTLSRTAACGDFKASNITIRVSRLRLNADSQPVPGQLLAVRRVRLRSNPCDSRVVHIPARTPFRIDVSANGTFQPSEFDLRELSAQVGFGFRPGR